MQTDGPSKIILLSLDERSIKSNDGYKKKIDLFSVQNCDLSSTAQRLFYMFSKTWKFGVFAMSNTKIDSHDFARSI